MKFGREVMALKATSAPYILIQQLETFQSGET
jgi:hypothetical protein